jgi:hypothetical protein
LELVKQPDGALDRLIARVSPRPDRKLIPDDFAGWSRSARFYPLLYMLTRVCRSKDWDSGVELSRYLLGKGSALQLHHIFPKALLYKHGYSRPDVNAIANFTFLTQETNLRLSDRSPSSYLAEVAERQPGALESHWIPVDPTLWQVDNYHDFLAARRVLLAEAANTFLESLLIGTAPEEEVSPPVLERGRVAVPGSVATEDEERMLQECREWVTLQGLPAGEYMYELTDPSTGDPVAFFDLAWPNGLQEGYSQPVALLIDEGIETEEAANRAGYRYFTDVTSFRTYVLREILAVEEEEPPAA